MCLKKEGEMKKRVLKAIGLLMFAVALGSVFVVPAYSRGDTGECYKHTDRICIVGEHYFEGYALVDKYW